MVIIYDLAFLAFAVSYLPVFLYKRKLHAGFWLRLGLLPKDLRIDNPIWIHAVSVGEAVAVSGLLEELRKAFPGKGCVISTVTATGNKIARRLAAGGDFVSYLPLDLSFVVKNTIDRVKPAAFIIAETEIWPNLISYLHKKRIPIVVVNGRISESSFRGYRLIKLLVKPILHNVSLFCVQTSRDAQRLVYLGVSRDKIRVTGNMKFDVANYPAPKSNCRDLRLKLGLKDRERLLVAGSTHPGEERIILGTYKELLKNFPDLVLLIAPRHPERAKEVSGLIEDAEFKAVRVSLLDMGTSGYSDTRRVFVLDTVGELFSFYSIADMVFVGGSLVKKGGHNILEPASQGKPIIFGPHMFNFRDIADLFLQSGAGILVEDGPALKKAVSDLLKDSSKIELLGRRSKEVLLQNQGATKKNLECIKEVIGKTTCL